MTALVTTAALLVSMAALLSAGVTLLATRSVIIAVPVLLDLLLAATLLRLALQPSPTQILGTALLVLIKRFTSTGIRRAIQARAGAPDTSPTRRRGRSVAQGGGGPAGGG